MSDDKKEPKAKKALKLDRSKPFHNCNHSQSKKNMNDKVVVAHFYQDQEYFDASGNHIPSMSQKGKAEKAAQAAEARNK